MRYLLVLCRNGGRMKIFHISDIHIGKQLYGYSLLEDQRSILKKILELAKEEKPDALLICGDIYDRSIPSGEAMTLFDEFLVQAGRLPFVLPMLIIAGNHDSPERLRYGREFLREHNIYISVLPPQKEEEAIEKVILEDEYGTVNFYLLPFVRPGMVRTLLPQEAALGEQSIIEKLLDREQIDKAGRNVLLSHQFYISGGSAPEQCDSEQPHISVGGLDEIDCRIASDFDYVALGHIHSPQNLGVGNARYCGTPLQYSVSEAGQKKSVTVVELGAKGTPLAIRTLPLKPEHIIHKLEGSLKDIIGQAKEKGRDYVSITLTEETTYDQPKQLLEPYYDKILEIKVDNERIRHILEETTADYQKLNPLEAFESFFLETQGRNLLEEEEQLIQEIIQEIGEE